MSVDSFGQNVHYILLAEFDLTKGSIIKHQYPQTIPGYEDNSLAEVMLPEGAHNRDEDWTIFLLNRDPEEAKRHVALQKASRSFRKSIRQVIREDRPVNVIVYLFSTDVGDWEALGSPSEKQTLLLQHSSELVVTGTESGVLVSVPIHAHLQYTVLQPQFVSVYRPDGRAVGFYFEKEDDQLYVGEMIKECLSNKDNNDDKIAPELEEMAKEQATSKKRLPFLFCLNLVRTKRDSNVKRGALVKAMAICSQHRFFHIYKPLLVLALDTYFDNPSVDVLAYLYQTINSMDLSTCPKLSQLERRVERLVSMASPTGASAHDFSTSITWDNGRVSMKIPVRVPLTMEYDEVGEASLTELIKLFKEGTLHIYNAILTEKRVLFVGYLRPAGEVCRYVLSACLLVSPPLKGVLKRAYPYAFLTNLDFLEVPGYIAGVTNPIFEQRDCWWDVMCDLSTGRVVTKPDTEELHPLDYDLMRKVETGINAHYSEDWVRAHFWDYTQHIVDITYGVEEFVDDAAARLHHEAYRPRIEVWKRTKSYEKYDKDRTEARERRTVKNDKIGKHVRRLRVKKNITEKEIMEIYSDFITYIKTEEQLMEFLSYLPDSQGGLYPIAVSLLHGSEPVRLATTALLRRLDQLKAGMKCVSSLNYFLLLAYHRNVRELNLDASQADPGQAVDDLIQKRKKTA